MADHAGEIMRILGRLEEGIERLRADMDGEKADRGRVHGKLEKIEEDVRIVGQAAAQAHTEAVALKKLVDEDVKPATDDFRHMRALGLGLLGLLGLAFTALGVTLATVGDSVVQMLRGWLRIP